MYRYTYIGIDAIYLPQFGINTASNDTTFVYETSEPINHPEFTLISQDEQVVEQASEPAIEPVVEEQVSEPVVEQPVEQPSEPVNENVSAQEGNSIE